YEAFYTDLLALKRENQALWNGAFGGELTILNAPNDEVMVYSRKKGGNEVVVALNFGTEAVSLDLSTLNVDDSFTAMSADDVTFDGGNTLEFPANEWIIFSK
ncbi:MAG: alpha-glucosidase C-terminal domain-containing protein, partial [Bacteroidota bacterium]